MFPSAPQPPAPDPSALAAPLGDVDVAVIGGGLVGACVALGLSEPGARRGRSIAVIDEGDVAFRASRGNFALVWVQGKGLSRPAYARLSLESSDLWADFARDLGAETGVDVRHERPGGVDLCFSEAELEARAAALNRLHNSEPGIARCEALSHAELRRLLPAIGPRVAGGVFCAADGHANSLKLFRALHEALARRGVAYRAGAAVAAIRAEGSGFRIETARGAFGAGVVVLAAGLGNARLAPFVGLRAPVRPERGQILVTEKLAPFLRHPLATARQTDEGGVMLGDSKEGVGLDDGTTLAVQGAIAARAVAGFPRLAAARIVRGWSALRVLSPDGHPIYDRSAAHPNAYLVTCHSGVTLAAAHARRLAPLIASGNWPPPGAAAPVGAFDPTPFSARRFGDVPASA